MAATLFCNRCGFASADDAQFCQACGTLFSSPVAPVGNPLTHSIPAFRFAGFWIRVAAALLDFPLLLGVMYPVRLLLGSAVTAIGMDAQFPVHTVMRVRFWV